MISDPELDLIRSLAAILGETGLSEIELERKGTRFRVSRAMTAAVHMPATPFHRDVAPVTVVAAAGNGNGHAEGEGRAGEGEVGGGEGPEGAGGGEAGEVREYLMFRMRAAGYRGPDLFSDDVVKMIARGSGGLTRRINLIADKGLQAIL